VVNGVDSSLLDANESLVGDGDIVTVIPIIHGG
jgi:molybdopterin converting factor small subunit